MRTTNVYCRAATSEQRKRKAFHRSPQNEVLGNALFRQSLDSLSRISRYESNLRRHYHNTLKELRTLRKAGRQAAFFRGINAGLSSRQRAARKAEPPG